MPVQGDQEDGEISHPGKCYKYLLFGFNVLFLLCGMIAVALGLFILVYPVIQHIAVLIKLNKMVGYVLVVVGFLALMVALFGCCGAKSENKCLLVMYFCLVLAIFVIECIIGILAYLYYTKAEISVENSLKDSLMHSYGQDGKEEVTAAWNYIQEWFECCGIKVDSKENAALFYEDSRWFLRSTTKLPLSCCQRGNETFVNAQACQDRGSGDWLTYINNKDCYGAILTTAAQYSPILAGIGATVAVVQLFAMVLSFCLYRRLAITIPASVSQPSAEPDVTNTGKNHVGDNENDNENDNDTIPDKSASTHVFMSELSSEISDLSVRVDTLIRQSRKKIEYI